MTNGNGDDGPSDRPNYSNIRPETPWYRAVPRALANRFLSGPYPGDRGINMLRRRAWGSRESRRYNPRTPSR